MFCLVAIYSVIGEDLKPHLAQLTGSKVASAARRLVLTDGGPYRLPVLLFLSGRLVAREARGPVCPTFTTCVLGLCKRRALTVMST